MAVPLTVLNPALTPLEQVLESIGLLKDFPHPKFLTCIVSEVNRVEVPGVVRFA